jgi:glycosyltransferase involved in cell wall biosynthesis
MITTDLSTSELLSNRFFGLLKVICQKSSFQISTRKRLKTLGTSNKISIAMCTYNGERYLREQLGSIASQTTLPAELILCDDGSVDSTLKIAEDFASTSSFKVKIHRNPKNLGITKNFEQAICLCSGDFIALCDQDDVWYPQKLANLSAFLSANPSASGVFSNADLIDENSLRLAKTLWSAFDFAPKFQHQFMQGDPISVLLKRGVVTGAAFMIRADLRAAFLPIPASWLHDDWITWMLVLKSRLMFTAEHLFGYRIHSSQQAGVPKLTLRGRMSQPRADENTMCRERAQRFRDLQACLRDMCFDPSPGLIRDIENVIQHSEARANFGRSRFARLRYVLSHYSAYDRYSNGPRTMLKDILQA